MSNEAAERLRTEWTGPGWTDVIRKPTLDHMLNEALAAERRATVERIRERVAKEAHSPNCEYGSDIAAILDEEAAP